MMRQEGVVFGNGLESFAGFKFGEHIGRYWDRVTDDVLPDAAEVAAEAAEDGAIVKMADLDKFPIITRVLVSRFDSTIVSVCCGHVIFGDAEELALKTEREVWEAQFGIALAQRGGSYHLSFCDTTPMPRILSQLVVFSKDDMIWSCVRDVVLFDKMTKERAREKAEFARSPDDFSHEALLRFLGSSDSSL